MMGPAVAGTYRAAPVVNAMYCFEPSPASIARYRHAAACDAGGASSAARADERGFRYKLPRLLRCLMTGHAYRAAP